MSALCRWSPGLPGAVTAEDGGNVTGVMSGILYAPKSILFAMVVSFAAASSLGACSRSDGPAPVEYGSGNKDARANSTTEPKIDAVPQPKVQRQALPPPKPAVKTPPPPPGRIVTPPPKDGHLVSRGETVYGVARRYGVPIRAIIEGNQLSPPYKLRLGQRLNIPPPQFHQVQAGETLNSIARLYDLSLSQLVRENEIPPPYRIRVGSRLRLPEAQAAAKPRASLDNPPKPRLRPERGDKAPVYGQSSSAQAPPRAGRRFAWPVQGRIVSRFGVKSGGLYNDGINIRAREGSAVRAADNGVIAYRGNELPGFGNLLLIRHDGGWMTAYAHNQKIVVKPGQKVKRGQLVARVGRSGKVGEPQLHFEIRKGRRAVDPMRYLAASAVNTSALR